jgi:hypothetical protein
VRADETPQKEKTHETFYYFDVRNRPGRRSVPCGPDPQHRRAGFAQYANGEKHKKHVKKNAAAPATSDSTSSEPAKK